MKPLYVVHYTLFGAKYNGFKSYYKFLYSYKELLRFLGSPNIHKENCIIFTYSSLNEDL